MCLFWCVETQVVRAHTHTEMQEFVGKARWLLSVWGTSFKCALGIQVAETPGRGHSVHASASSVRLRGCGRDHVSCKGANLQLQD